MATTNSNFDVEAYINNYQGYTRLKRMHFISQQNTTLKPDVLRAAIDEVRKRDPKARVDEATGRIDFEEHLPAVFAHPTTGEPLWFNGVHTNHKSYYEEAEHVDTSDGSPMHTAYADGTDIPDETIAVVRAAVWNHSVAVRCQTGDVIVVDNMLASHGRMGWMSGHPRKVLLTHFQ